MSELRISLVHPVQYSCVSTQSGLTRFADLKHRRVANSLTLSCNRHCLFVTQHCPHRTVINITLTSTKIDAGNICTRGRSDNGQLSRKKNPTNG